MAQRAPTTLDALTQIGTFPLRDRTRSGALDSQDGLIAMGSVLSLAGGAIGAYHGYKRNDSIGWAIAWSLLGGLFPIVVIPVAFAQGIGSPK